MRKKILILFVIFIGLILVNCSNSHYLKIKGRKLYIEISITQSEREKGLSKREKLEKDKGMLFVYPEEKVLYFWMKDTSIPLSIAFIRGNGVVIGIYNMKPFSLDTITSIYPARYALEVNKGWFKKAGLKVGDYIDIPDYSILLKWHNEQEKN